MLSKKYRREKATGEGGEIWRVRVRRGRVILCNQLGPGGKGRGSAEAGGAEGRRVEGAGGLEGLSALPAVRYKVVTP